MHLVSWFKNASTAQKVGAVALATINALTLMNSVAVGHKIANLELGKGSGYSPTGDILIAPLFTGTTWILSEEASGTPIGTTPISLIANQTKKVLPKPADIVLGIAVTAIGIPGAWAGHTVGAVTGFSSNAFSASKPKSP